MQLLIAGALVVEAVEAALGVVGFLAAPGVAHEPEAAGGVDLNADPEGAEEGRAFSLPSSRIRHLSVPGFRGRSTHFWLPHSG